MTGTKVFKQIMFAMFITTAMWTLTSCGDEEPGPGPKYDGGPVDDATVKQVVEDYCGQYQTCDAEFFLEDFGDLSGCVAEMTEEIEYEFEDNKTEGAEACNELYIAVIDCYSKQSCEETAAVMDGDDTCDPAWEDYDRCLEALYF